MTIKPLSFNSRYNFSRTLLARFMLSIFAGLTIGVPFALAHEKTMSSNNQQVGLPSLLLLATGGAIAGSASNRDIGDTQSGFVASMDLNTQ